MKTSNFEPFPGFAFSSRFRQRKKKEAFGSLEKPWLADFKKNKKMTLS
jgi:hypothetical protein